MCNFRFLQNTYSDYKYKFQVFYLVLIKLSKSLKITKYIYHGNIIVKQNHRVFYIIFIGR